MSKLTKEQYEANQKAKREKKRLENEQFKAQRDAKEQAELENSTRKPVDVQQDIGQAYFRLGQATFGIKSLEMVERNETGNIARLEDELTKSYEVWGYPTDEDEPKEAQNAVATQ